jgi:hypothetical protein
MPRLASQAIRSAAGHCRAGLGRQQP